MGFFKWLRKTERGQAMMEYAFILPIFLITLFGVIDISWIIYQKVVFGYTCRQTTWDLNLREYDEYVMNTQTPITRRDIPEEYANRLLEEQFIRLNQNTGTHIKMQNISITEGEINIYPSVKTYQYATPSGMHSGYKGYKLPFIATTLEIKGKIKYKVRPLTPFFNMLFKEKGKQNAEFILTNNLYKIKRGSMKVPKMQF